MNIKLDRAEARAVIMVNAIAIRQFYHDPTPISDHPLSRAQARLLESYYR